MTKLLSKLKEAERLQDLSSTYHDESERLKEEIWDVLGSRYSLVLDREERSKYSWQSRDFDFELQLLLRSMIKRDKVIHVPGKFPENSFNLTQKYGLKWPRTWSYHSFLPYRTDRDGVPSFSKGVYKGEGLDHIDFRVLKNNKVIDSKKLSKFFYFLTEIVQIYKAFFEIQKDFEKNFKKGEGLRDLSSFSALETFTRFLEKEPKLRKFYGSYKSRLKKFKKKQDKLCRELKAYNKPFRLLLVLKEDEINY